MTWALVFPWGWFALAPFGFLYVGGRIWRTWVADFGTTDSSGLVIAIMVGACGAIAGPLVVAYAIADWLIIHRGLSWNAVGNRAGNALFLVREPRPKADELQARIAELEHELGIRP